MKLPSPPPGDAPNIEVLWAGDRLTNHLSVSIRIGTFFGVSNAFSEKVAHDVVDCKELCECDIHADTGDLMASFHVSPEHWADFAHAVHKNVMRHVASHSEEWDKRHKAPVTLTLVGDSLHTTKPRLLN